MTLESASALRVQHSSTVLLRSRRLYDDHVRRTLEEKVGTVVRSGYGQGMVRCCILLWAYLNCAHDFGMN